MGNFIPIDRDAAFKPRIVSTNPSHERQEIAESVLPKGATTVPRPRRTASGGYFGGNMPMGTSPMGGGGGGSASYHMQRPYFPGTESPDRVQYPKTRQEANKAWRLFHETDPIFGTAVDMYAEMLVSDFDIIVGDEKSREIRDTLEYMCQETNLQETLRYIIKEYLVMGEAIPHCFYDDSLGIWTHIAMHNPDYIDVVDAPIVNMDPILNFIPDDALRDTLMDNSPEARDLKDRLPAEFVAKILARQKIRLSPLNSTFIARKLHPYQIRGTSMASRMWRIFMVEDAVYNSTIATFRRHAAPVKVVKLGDASSGWLPAPGAETKVLQMLNRVETDPQAWLVYNYGINFEAWGTTDKAISISKEHDVIEKVKLLALGLSKSFMTGEVTYASAKSGLQVFLRRLLSLRQFLENVWLYPKFFRPISEINEWTTASPSEVNHKYRIKRTAQEIQEQNLVMMPTLKWKNKLDPSVDQDLLNAYGMLEKLGVKLSKATISSAVGLDWQDELEGSLKEFKSESEMKDKILGDNLKEKYDQAHGQVQQQGAQPPGAPGSGAKPPGAPGGAKPGGAPAPGGMNDASKPPGSAPAPGGSGDIGSIEAPSGGGLSMNVT